MIPLLRPGPPLLFPGPLLVIRTPLLDPDPPRSPRIPSCTPEPLPRPRSLICLGPPRAPRTPLCAPVSHSYSPDPLVRPGPPYEPRTPHLCCPVPPSRAPVPRAHLGLRAHLEAGVPARAQKTLSGYRRLLGPHLGCFCAPTSWERVLGLPPPLLWRRARVQPREAEPTGVGGGAR